MAITYLDVEERMQVTFPPITADILPLQSGVTAWITNTVPRTITDLGLTSSDEMVLDFTVDLVKEFRWDKVAAYGNSAQTPAGTRNIGKKPTYPSAATIIKYNIGLSEAVAEPQHYRYSSG